MTENSSSSFTAGTRRKAKPFVAGVTCLALGMSGVLLSAPAANAATLNESQARFLSGASVDSSALAGPLAGQRTAIAPNDENGGGSSTAKNTVDLSELGDSNSLNPRADFQVPISFSNAGSVGEYTNVSSSGEARAAVGAITEDGNFDLGTGVSRGTITLNLDEVLGRQTSTDVNALSLVVDTPSAVISKKYGEKAVGNYAISNLTLNFTSPLAQELQQDLLNAGKDTSARVNSVLAKNGTMDTEITEAVSGLGTVNTFTNYNIDLSPAIQGVLDRNEVLGQYKPVSLDLKTGVVSVDVGNIVTAQGKDLNRLDPSTVINDPAFADYVTSELQRLTNNLVAEVDEAVKMTVESSNLDYNVVVLNSPDIPLTLSLNAPVGAIQSGEAKANIITSDPSFDTTALDGIISKASNDALNTGSTGAPVATKFNSILPAAKEALTGVSLVANVQESVDETFTLTALQLGLFGQIEKPELISFSRASVTTVNPSAAATTTPVIEAVSPASGSINGNTEVTVSGKNLSNVKEVYFGDNLGTNLIVVSDTELRVTSPASFTPGLASLRLVAENGEETTSVDAFNYVGDGTVVTPPVDGGETPVVEEPPVTQQPNGNGGVVGPQDNGGVYYENCDDAQAKGAGPINRGESGYRAGLDKDNDGVACEGNVAASRSGSLANTGAAPVAGIALGGASLLLIGGGIFLYRRFTTVA